MTTPDWTPAASTQPPEGVVVQCMDSGGHVQDLVRKGRLYFYPDMSMYVYYVPRFWKAKPPTVTMRRHAGCT